MVGPEHRGRCVWRNVWAEVKSMCGRDSLEGKQTRCTEGPAFLSPHSLGLPSAEKNRGHGTTTGVTLKVKSRERITEHPLMI